MGESVALLGFCAECGVEAVAHPLVMRGGGDACNVRYARGLPASSVPVFLPHKLDMELLLPDDLPGLADDAGKVYAAADACQKCGGRITEPFVTITRPSGSFRYCGVSCALKGGATPLQPI